MKKMNEMAILVGAVPLNYKQIEAIRRLARAGQYIVAVDGGMNSLKLAEVEPDLWIGDMDSFGEEYINQEKQPDILLPVMKDETDMAVALKSVYDKGYRQIIIYGGLGGERISHMIANFQLACTYTRRGCNVQLVGEKCRAEFLINGRKDYAHNLKGKISIFSHSDISKGVIIEGLEYCYKGDLSKDNPLGVSNSFVGNAASILVEAGELLIIYES